MLCSVAVAAVPFASRTQGSAVPGTRRSGIRRCRASERAAEVVCGRSCRQRGREHRQWERETDGELVQWQQARTRRRGKGRWGHHVIACNICTRHARPGGGGEIHGTDPCESTLRSASAEHMQGMMDSTKCGLNPTPPPCDSEGVRAEHCKPAEGRWSRRPVW